MVAAAVAGAAAPTGLPAILSAFSHGCRCHPSCYFQVTVITWSLVAADVTAVIVQGTENGKLNRAVS